MNHRKRLLQVATVLLYMGPLLAGLAGFGPALLVPFVSLFMLWLILLRPHNWPQTAQEWLKPTSLLAAFTLVATQLFFVAVLFCVGRGIGGVLGYVPLYHPLLPVTLSVMALPLLRLVWNPELALVNDDSIDQLLWTGDTEGAGARPVSLSAEAAVSGLFALSEDGKAGAEHMLDALDQFLDTGDIWARLAVLAGTLDASPASEHVALRRAVILKATDPIPQSQFTVPGEMRTAFAAAGNSAALLSLLAVRGRALLHKIPAAAHYFPPHQVVQELAADCADSATARALSELALELGRAAPEAGPQPKPAQKAATPRGFVAPSVSAQGA